MPGIYIGNRVNKSSSSYWTPQTLVVENVQPTKVVMTGLVANTSAVASDFTIAGFTVSSLARDATNKILTLTLSTSVLYGDSLTVVYRGVSYVVTNNVALDTNAAAFLTAQSNTDETQKKALNKFVIDLKAINAVQANFVNFDTPSSSVIKAIYPFIGGTAASHKWNLINPADSDAAFRLHFGGTLTHDTNGVLPDGASGYADTHIGKLSLTQNSESLAYYSLTNSTKDAIEMGCRDDNGKTSWLSMKYTALGGAISWLNAAGASACAVAADTRGLFIGNRISNVRHDLWRNNEKIASSTTTNGDVLADLPIYLFAQCGTGGAQYFTDRRCCYAHIANGIDDVSIQSYIKAVQDLQVALSRGDMYVPVMATTGNPAPGMRVKTQIAGWDTDIYHSVYLPSNYSTDRTWPVIIELPGNNSLWRNGLPESYHLGYGLSKGLDFIWVVAPFINADKSNMAPVWWGDGSDPATQSITSTTDYLDAILSDLENNYHADLSKVVLTGFSRGAVACGYMGCSSDAYASKFIAWMPHSQHDGATYTVSGAARLARMLGKKTCITSGANGLDTGYANTQTGLGLVQAAGVTEEHYTIANMGHDIEHSLRVDDTTVESIRTFLAQYK